ncbi:hypothetical protein P8935_00520 [Telmatobacter sp. DSM 110680]|uniref:Uncharacterized protein n=1 Tax=Telmatobacter sp. DSM 110680 TaxID=3036704 RepID=A0AAU7DKD4_9BACT
MRTTHRVRCWVGRDGSGRLACGIVASMCFYWCRQLHDLADSHSAVRGTYRVDIIVSPSQRFGNPRYASVSNFLQYVARGSIHVGVAQRDV